MTILVFTHRLIILVVSVKSDAKFRCILKQAYVVFSQKLVLFRWLHYMCRLVWSPESLDHQVSIGWRYGEYERLRWVNANVFLAADEVVPAK